MPRIYIVETPAGKHLVNAASPAAAMKHVVRGTIKVRIPTPQEIFTLGASGTPLECANDADVSDQSRPHLAQSHLALDGGQERDDREMAQLVAEAA